MTNKRLQMTPEFKALIKAFQIIDHQRDRQRQKDPEFNKLISAYGDEEQVKQVYEMQRQKYEAEKREQR